MKIGIFTDTYLPEANGITTYLDFIFNKLPKKGNKLHVVAPRYSIYKKQKNEENISRLVSIRVNKAYNYRLAVYIPIKTFIKLLRTDFDIIHGHSNGSISLMGLFMAKIKRVPFVYTYHTMIQDYSHYILRGLFSPSIIRKISRVTCNLCDVIIAPSEKAKNELINQKIKKPVIVVPYGIETKNFQIKKSDFLRKKLGIARNAKILLYAGRLGREKSVDFLIYAFNIILKSNSRTHFVIIGKGPEYTYLKSLSERLKIDKNVYFLGAIEPKNMPIIYKSADIFVFSSKTETQGLVVLEAMASGLPVVAVKDSPIENVIRNKESGVLVDNDVVQFAEEVIKLLKNKKERERLGKNARVSANLFVENSVLKLEEIYNKVLKKK